MSADQNRHYVEAESLLPHGDVLSELASDDVYLVIQTADVGYERQHWWIGRESGEFVGVKRTPTQKAVVRGELDDAVSWLTPPDFYDAEEVLSKVVDRDRTPLPYDLAPTVRRECPECGAFGQIHEWKWQRKQDSLRTGCSCCEYGGGLNVSRV